MWFSYDAENRVQVVNGALVDGQIVVAAKQANSDVESYALHYDAAGHAVSRTTVTESGATQVAQSTYTLRGELALEYAAVNVGETTGVVARHVYDAAGREIERTEYFAPGTHKFYDSYVPRVQIDPDEPGTTVDVDVSGWASHQTQTSYDVDGRALLVRELGRSGESWYKGTPDPALTALSNVFYSTGTGGSGYDAAGMLVTYRYQNLKEDYTHTYTTRYEQRDRYLEKSVTGTSTDDGYRTTSTSSGYDQMGRRVKITQTTPLDGQAPLTQSRSFSFNADGGILSRRDSGVTQHYVYANGQQVATLGEDGKVDAASQLTAFDSSQMGTEPAMVLEGDTLQRIAQRVYGNSSLWYVLAAANAVTDAELVAGTTLKVPPVKTTANDATTFKPFDPNSIQGATTPSLPYIAPPPKHGCKQLAITLVATITRVVGQIIGTIISKFPPLAWLGPIIGAASEFDAQTLERWGGMRDHYDWAAVAVAGVSTLIGGAFAKAAKGAGNLARLGYTAASAASQYAASYAINKAAGNDVHFSWNTMAAGMVTSMVSSSIGGGSSQPAYEAGQNFSQYFSWSAVAQQTVRNVAVNALNKGITQAITGEQQDWNAGRMVVDAFGNALGNAAVRKMQSSRINKLEITKETIEQERLQIDPGKLELIPPTGLAGESLGAHGGVAGGGVVPTYAMAAEAARDRARVLNSLQTLGKPLTDNQLQELIYSTHLYDDRFGQKVYETIASPVGLNSDQLEVWKAQWAEFDKGLPANHSVIVNPDTIRAAMTTAEISAAADASVARDARLLVEGYAALAGIGAGGALAVEFSPALWAAGRSYVSTLLNPTRNLAAWNEAVVVGVDTVAGIAGDAMIPSAVVGGTIGAARYGDELISDARKIAMTARASAPTIGVIAKASATNRTVVADEVASLQRIAAANNSSDGRIFNSRISLKPYIVGNDVNGLINRLDVDAAGKSLGFWSGNLDAAMTEANRAGIALLESTPGGKIVNNWSFLNKRWTWENGGEQFWGGLSTKYASGASGDVFVWQAPNKAFGDSGALHWMGGTIWQKYELKTINNLQDVGTVGQIRYHLVEPTLSNAPLRWH